MVSQQLTYVLSETDQILHVDDGWLHFALENGAPGLSFEAIAGRPVWEFIADERTRDAYRTLLSQIRRHQRVHQFRYRCDSPERMRVLEMFITPLGDGRLHLESRLLFQKARIPLRILTASSIRADTSIAMCSICKKIQMSRDVWIDIEQAEKELDSLFRGVPVWIQDLCPDCPSRLTLC